MNLYFVQSGMNVPQNVEEEILVLPVEVDKRQYNVEKGVAQMPLAFINLQNRLVIDNGGIGIPVIVVHSDSSVYQYGKLIDETLFLIGHGIAFFIQVDDFFRFVLSEDEFLIVLVFEKYLGKNEHTIPDCMAIEIAYVVDAHVAVGIT